MKMCRVLAIDDDLSFLKSVESLLKFKKIDVDTLQNPLDADKKLKNKCYDCILLDVEMEQMNGIDVLKHLETICPSTPVIMLSGRSNISIAVQAIKNGAYDFIEKPLDADRLLIAIRNASNKKEWNEERLELVSNLDPMYKMVGESLEFNKILRTIDNYANTDIKVLILGETGVGKELVAGAIHYRSARSGKPLIKINCAAIPNELLESELFGYSKGSYTGAVKDYQGKFDQADGGTLFLDEIGDMDLSLQSKLLRVLDNGEIDPIGSSNSQKVNVRVICASNKDLDLMAQNGRFRQDLLHRINALKIVVPPLRNRKEDIKLLARFFLQKFSEKYNKRLIDFTPEAINLLNSYDYPGNVRELKNMIENVAILTSNSIINTEDFYGALGLAVSEETTDKKPVNLEEAKKTFEKEHILHQLEQNKWKITNTANELGIDRTSLFKKMRKLDIKKDK
jgi:DNA-binding NtrC family response regulator